jgi:hypothetical protein
VAFLAIDKNGGVGGACTDASFSYAVARPGKIELVKAKEIRVME